MSYITETNSDYHNRPGISASKLKLIRESPRKYLATIDGRIARNETPAMKIGTAIHSRVLEPDCFDSAYVICPADCSDRRTKKHKEWAAAAGNKIVLTESEFEVISCACNAIENHPVASRFFPADDKEKSVLYQDHDTGEACRLRFDLVKGSAICDIKTISECDPEQIERDSARFGYHIQAAHYLAGMATVTQNPNWRFFFIFVETCEPFRCRVFEPGYELLECGKAERAYFIKDLARRQQTGDWSEPAENELNVLSLPKYYRSRI